MTAGRPAAAAAASAVSEANRILLRKWSPDAAATMATTSSSAFAKANTTFESIRREAWEVAYSHIYSADEVGRYFDGKAKEGRTWPSIPCQHEETLVCEVPPSSQQSSSSTAICAYAKWGWTPHAQAELHSLYVSPSYWNRGCGSMLWDAIMTKCRTEQVQSMDIWVLKAARSGEFYAARGCQRVAEGDYFIGEKKETAVCYQWAP